MEVSLPPRIEHFPRHRARLEAACRACMGDPGVIGMAIGGSFASEKADALSDLDLQLFTEDSDFDGLTVRLRAIADKAGPVVAAFTAEHVGLPHMLIVLYHDLIHADFEPVKVSNAAARNRGLACFVLWQREEGIREALAGRSGDYQESSRGVAWMERRMWTWIWYVQAKILRGELYEALDGIQYMRHEVLFRLLALGRRELPSGARRAEARVGGLAARFAATVPGLDSNSLMRALRETTTLYVQLADPLLEREDVPQEREARRVVGMALTAGLAWRPSAD